jgi:hypothetical protein
MILRGANGTRYAELIGNAGAPHFYGTPNFTITKEAHHGRSKN